VVLYVGDAWEILANVEGKRDHPGSCALKALPDIQEGHDNRILFF
jgi:hypothetical protein